jgi:hypothetical protein
VEKLESPKIFFAIFASFAVSGFSLYQEKILKRKVRKVGAKDAKKNTRKISEFTRKYA